MRFSFNNFYHFSIQIYILKVIHLLIKLQETVFVFFFIPDAGRDYYRITKMNEISETLQDESLICD